MQCGLKETTQKHWNMKNSMVRSRQRPVLSLFRHRPKQVWELRLRGETRWFVSEARALRWLEGRECDYILYSVEARGRYNYVFAKRSRGVRRADA